jgi:Tol biopolymer transport system component
MDGAQLGKLGSMCAWRSSVVVLVAALSACSFAPPPDVGDDDDDSVSDGGPDGPDTPSPDAAPDHRFTRAFLVENGSLSVVDVNDGVPATTHAIGAITSSAISEDGAKVIYASGADAYVVPIAQTGMPGTAVRIGGSHGGSGTTIMGLFVTPDGGRAVYGWGDPALFIPSQYYVVDISTSTPGSPVPVGTGGASYVSHGVLSPNGSMFAFIEAGGVYVVDISAPTPSATKTVVAPNTNYDLGRLQFNETSTKIAFAGDLITNDVFELFVADVTTATPGTPERASAALPVNWDVEGTGFFSFGAGPTSTDGSQLVYAITDSAQAAREIFVVDISGAVPGSARKVNDTLVSGGSVSYSSLQPDGSRVAYVADQRTNDIFELFVANVVDGVPSTPQRVSGALVAGGDVMMFELARDGSGIWYVADQRTNDVFELFYVDLRGAAPSAPQLVNAALPTGGDVGGDNPTQPGRLSRDGSWLGYFADQAVDGQVEMYVADVSSGTPMPGVRLQMASGAATAFGGTFSRDSSLVFWSGGVVNQQDVWMVDLTAPTPWEPVKLNSARPASITAVRP